MLDKKEKATELNRCIMQQMYLRVKLEPWWPLLEHRTQRMIVKNHLRDPKHENYGTIATYIDIAIGRACLQEIIRCENPVAR